MTKEDKYIRIGLGVILTGFGLLITIGGNYYDSFFRRVIDFMGLHVPFGLFTAGIGILFIIMAFRKGKFKK